MEIFKDYNTSDVLFDIPFVDENMKLKLYPVKVNKYKEFDTLTKYLLFSKKHYKLDNTQNLFEFIIAVGVNSYNTELTRKNIQKTSEELLFMVIRDFERLLSIICREPILYDGNQLFQKGEVIFANIDRSIIIGRGNYEMLRQIVLKQNALREPKIFENQIEERMAKKYMMALQKKNKGKSISELGEIANFVSCITGKSYEELYNQNVMQLYTDYYRCLSIEAYKSSTLFMTVSDKVKPNEFNEEVIPKLFADPYEGMWRDRNSFGFLQ